MSKISFSDWNLPEYILDALAVEGWEKPTEIQREAIPPAREGCDIIGQARTGSGKTAAFGIPIIERSEPTGLPQSIVLCPTRELATQVCSELQWIQGDKGLIILPVYGGTDLEKQAQKLNSGVDIIVGTPGRVIDMTKRKHLNLQSISLLCLDEADRMLDMGFSEDIFKITSHIPKDRQTLLFSATFPEDIEKLSENLQNNPERVSVDITHDDSKITEEFIELDSHKEKLDALKSILGHYNSQRFIVFCKTKKISDSVANELYRDGIMVSSIHGDLEQNERTEVLTMFSNKSLSGIVATDVAARGIDIKGLDLVVNFDISNDPEVYVHRIGRTGRAGEEGLAVSFITPYEMDSFEKILDYQQKEHGLKRIDNFNEEQKKYLTKPDMKTLIISGGKRDKLRPGDLVGAIVGESGIDFKSIGDISITNMKSYVAIHSENASLVCDKLNNGKIKNKKFKVGIL